MKRINGFDEAHQCESLQLSHGRCIMIERIRWSHIACVIKRIRNAGRWIAIGRIRYIFRRFNLDRYTSSRSTVKSNTHPVRLISPRTPFTWVKINGWDFTRNRTLLTLPRCILSSIVDRDMIGRSRSYHVNCALLKFGKINFELEKSIFNSGKSLENSLKIQKNSRKIPKN